MVLLVWYMDLARIYNNLRGHGLARANELIEHVVWSSELRFCFIAEHPCIGLSIQKDISIKNLMIFCFFFLEKYQQNLLWKHTSQHHPLHHLAHITRTLLSLLPFPTPEEKNSSISRANSRISKSTVAFPCPIPNPGALAGGHPCVYNILVLVHTKMIEMHFTIPKRQMVSRRHQNSKRSPLTQGTPY